MSDARSCEPIALTAVALPTSQAIKKLLDDNFSPSASPTGTVGASPVGPLSSASQDLGSFRYGGLRRPRDRENLPHVLGEHLAIASRIARQRTLLVPEDNHLFAQCPAAVGYAGDTQIVATSSQLRWNDCHAMPEFSQREQGMWHVAFDEDVGLEPGKPAGRIERPAKHEV